MIFSINDVVKNTSYAIQRQIFTVLSINIYQAQTTMKMYYGRRPLLWNIHSLFFDDSTYFFFLSFFCHLKHLNFTVCSLLALLLCCMFECFTLRFIVYSKLKTSRRCCRWKITCNQQINILCLFSRYSHSPALDVSVCVHRFSQLNVFFALRFYLSNTATHSFTEKFYNKWHFLGFMKRDGWWCYLALDVFLSCVCARWWFQYIFFFFLVRFFSLLLWTKKRRNKKCSCCTFRKKATKRTKEGCCNDVAALKSWCYAQQIHVMKGDVCGRTDKT